MSLNANSTVERYTGDAYLADNPSWHEEDAPWKTGHIVRILSRNDVRPKSFCEVGCGSGAIVSHLADALPGASAEGFEIAPAAFERCLTRQRDGVHYTLGSPFGTGRHFDLCLAIDVIEHVENPFDFVREMKALSEWQVFHIPLDMNALATARGWVIMEARERIGHLHYFTRDTALAFLAECGVQVVDSFYTPWAIDQSDKTWKKRLAAYPRRIAFSMAPHLTVRSIGGWSLMVLTRSA